MGLLFGSSSKKNRKLIDQILRECARPERKIVTCPRCRTRSSVTFLSAGDSYTCRNCKYKIYANEV